MQKLGKKFFNLHDLFLFYFVIFITACSELKYLKNSDKILSIWTIDLKC